MAGTFDGRPRRDRDEGKSDASSRGGASRVPIESPRRGRTIDHVILLVEDNEDDAALALRAFRKHEPNREIHVAEDGVVALEFLHGKPGASPSAPLPRVVLLDLKLPKLDGFQVLERIRHEPRTSNLPVVMLTSSAEHTDIERSYALGANSYVRKPISFVEFLDAAKQLGDYWLSLNLTAPQG
ncbi:MAG: response regulator [Labilithrix sp.]|nr:response regulator [Labilithrix sp.]MBX3221648.1 response regulator [Labilithrix sp.]